MSLTIWKFTLEPECSIELPQNSQVLSVHEQRGEICMWALVNTSMPKVNRKFSVFGTGHEVPSNPHLNFIGTAMVQNNAFVFHVFEDTRSNL